MIKRFFKWLFGDCGCRGGYCDVQEKLDKIIKQGERIMAISDDVVKEIEDFKADILVQLTDLDTKVEGLYKIIGGISADDISPEARAKIETALGEVKTEVTAAIEKAGTDDPDV